jgi:hypothetical protein
MADQHRHLRVIYAELSEALAGATGLPETRQRFARYREAVEAHFSLESDTFFPAVRGLHADWGAALEELDRAHDRLRESLAAMERRIQWDAGGSLTRALSDFAGELRDHEAREEGLLAGLGENGRGESASEGGG